jgi:hypothetical protein
MQNPAWFGVRYAKFHDLEALAASLGVGIGYADIPLGLFYPALMGVPVIVLPSRAGPLETIWALAHELGHALRHSGPKGSLSYGKEEDQASRWAACALIPYDRIMSYRNASMDAMVAALSAHYEDLPLEDCPSRELAGKIAQHRLDALAQEVA